MILSRSIHGPVPRDTQGTQAQAPSPQGKSDRLVYTAVEFQVHGNSPFSPDRLGGTHLDTWRRCPREDREIQRRELRENLPGGCFLPPEKLRGSGVVLPRETQTTGSWTLRVLCGHPPSQGHSRLRTTCEPRLVRGDPVPGRNHGSIDDLSSRPSPTGSSRHDRGVASASTR